jgi:hypothetical protein
VQASITTTHSRISRADDPANCYLSNTKVGTFGNAPAISKVNLTCQGAACTRAGCLTFD